MITDPGPTWLSVTNTALHVVPAIRGSHQTMSTIARTKLMTTCTICRRRGRRRPIEIEPSLVMATSGCASRQTGEHVASNGRARRVGWVDEPLAAEYQVVQRARES